MHLIREYIENKPDDNELIESCRRGDEQAFSEIMRRHKGKIASVIFGMLGRCDAADDIGQEVFIRFYKSINSFRGEASISTYLTRIAINLSLNEIKRRKLRSFLSFEKMIEDGRDIMDSGAKIDIDQDKEMVQKAIQKLSAKYRTVLVLRLIDGYSTEETAQILNLPKGTVLSRLARAQMKLKEYLKPYISEI